MWSSETDKQVFLVFGWIAMLVGTVIHIGYLLIVR